MTVKVLNSLQILLIKKRKFHLTCRQKEGKVGNVWQMENTDAELGWRQNTALVNSPIFCGLARINCSLGITRHFIFRIVLPYFDIEGFEIVADNHVKQQTKKIETRWHIDTIIGICSVEGYNQQFFPLDPSPFVMVLPCHPFWYPLFTTSDLPATSCYSTNSWNC